MADCPRIPNQPAPHHVLSPSPQTMDEQSSLSRFSVQHADVGSIPSVGSSANYNTKETEVSLPARQITVGTGTLADKIFDTSEQSENSVKANELAKAFHSSETALHESASEAADCLTKLSRIRRLRASDSVENGGHPAALMCQIAGIKVEEQGQQPQQLDDVFTQYVDRLSSKRQKKIGQNLSPKEKMEHLFIACEGRVGRQYEEALAKASKARQDMSKIVHGSLTQSVLKEGAKNAFSQGVCEHVSEIIKAAGTVVNRNDRTSLGMKEGMVDFLRLAHGTSVEKHKKAHRSRQLNRFFGKMFKAPLGAAVLSLAAMLGLGILIVGALGPVGGIIGIVMAVAACAALATTLVVGASVGIGIALSPDRRRNYRSNFLEGILDGNESKQLKYHNESIASGKTAPPGLLTEEMKEEVMRAATLEYIMLYGPAESEKLVTKFAELYELKGERRGAGVFERKAVEEKFLHKLSTFAGADGPNQLYKELKGMTLQQQGAYLSEHLAAQAILGKPSVPASAHSQFAKST